MLCITLKGVKAMTAMKYVGKSIREDKRITQLELSKKSGVSRSIICGLETGRTTVTSTKTLFKIAQTLEVGINDLFSAENA
jgi:transcriptional regulator with XRE-family HTH domain